MKRDGEKKRRRAGNLGITLGRGRGSDCKTGGWSALDLSRAHMADLAMSPQLIQNQAENTRAGTGERQCSKFLKGTFSLDFVFIQIVT